MVQEVETMLGERTIREARVSRPLANEINSVPTEATRNLQGTPDAVAQNAHCLDRLLERLDRLVRDDER